MIEKIIRLFKDPTNTRPWWVLLGIMLLMYLFIHGVTAYQTSFQEYEYGEIPSGFQSPDGGSFYVVSDKEINSLYLETGIKIYLFPHVDNADYWEYTCPAACNEVYAYSQSLALLGHSTLSTGGSGPYCNRIFYSNGYIYIYYNDYYFTSFHCGPKPYYVGIKSPSGAITIDNVIVSYTQERNLISAFPEGWYIHSNPDSPAMSGLYHGDALISTTTARFSWVTYSGSGTIRISNNESGIIIYESAVSGYTGTLSLNLNTYFFSNSNALPGTYKIEILGTTTCDYFNYTGYPLNTKVEWDKPGYSNGETATITYCINSSMWDPYDYVYQLEILNSNLTSLTSWGISSQPVGNYQDVVISSGLFPGTGYYLCSITAIDRVNGTKYYLAYDTAAILMPGDVLVQGQTYNAITNTALGSCGVTITQNTFPHSTTSDATTGEYTVLGLTTDADIYGIASKTGYDGIELSFTPIISGIYTFDLPLIPSGGPSPGESSNSTTSYYNPSTEGTSVGGMCLGGPYWTLEEGCNITISNGTWSTSCTSGSGGWYQCNNLPCGGTYTLSCYKSGYETYTKSCTFESDCFNREDCMMDKISTLTVYCRSIDGDIINDCESVVELDTGETTTTTTGIATFPNLEYGYYTVSADAIGYYPGSTSVVLDQDKNVSVYMSKETERGAGISYAPKSVEFTVQTIWGKPISDCQVNCTGYETTVGSWEWLYQLFGIEENGTPIATSTMSGYTDYKGQINFMMFEPVKYECLFYKPGEINNNLSVYPKSDHYLILATEFGNASWYKGGSDINAMINCTVTTGDGPTSKDRNITLTYSDLTGGTVGGIVYLNQTNTTPGGAEICLSSWSGLTNNCTHTFTVTNCAGQSYFIRVRPNHTTWTFERDFAVSFPPEQVNPLGLTDTELALMSCFLILFVGLLFGGISAPHAPLVMSFLGWIFLALGWLNAIITTAVPALLLASVLSVAYLIMVRSKKERWV